MANEKLTKEDYILEPLDITPFQGMIVQKHSRAAVKLCPNGADTFQGVPLDWNMRPQGVQTLQASEKLYCQVCDFILFRCSAETHIRMYHDERRSDGDYHCLNRRYRPDPDDDNSDDDDAEEDTEMGEFDEDNLPDDDDHLSEPDDDEQMRHIRDVFRAYLQNQN